jgi:hypothetical protein
LTGPNQTDRAKFALKIHIICDRSGFPISAGISGANLHDSQALIPLMRGIPPIRSRYGPRKRARTEEGFTSARATRVMVAACRAAGLDDRGAELIRLGENALFRLASVPVIVRVARGEEWLPKARTEVAVSQWLAEEGFPAAAS